MIAPAIVSLLGTVLLSAQVAGPGDWSAKGGIASGRFGTVIANAGDVNRDGFDDLIVGAPDTANPQIQEGRVVVFYGHANGLSALPDHAIELNYANWRFGTSVAGIGDCDGDGYDDVAVGAPAATNGQSNEGRVYVYRGSPNGLLTSAPVIIEMNIAGAQLGWQVAKLGDVNGDGRPDFVALAPGINSGRLFFFYGTTSGVPTVASLAIDPPPLSGGTFGTMIVSGDFNRDGRRDLAVSDPDYGSTFTGAVYVYLNNSTPVFSATPSATIEGPTGDWSTGYGVTMSAGDLDGDGFADLAIGAPGWELGKAFVHYGRLAGLPPTAGWTLNGTKWSCLGSAVDMSRDLDGDGYVDLVITAVSGEANPAAPPAVQVRLGGTALPSATPAWSLPLNPSWPYLGRTACCGRFNQGTFGDIAVADPDYAGANPYEGIVAACYDVIAPPSAPTAAEQFTCDGTTAIPAGGTTGQSEAVFACSISHSLGRPVAMQVEFKPAGGTWDGTTDLHTGTEGPGGAVTLTVTLPEDSSMMWRVRAMCGNMPGPWTHFGGQADTDFVTPLNTAPRFPALKANGLAKGPLQVFEGESFTLSSVVHDDNGSRGRLFIEARPIGENLSTQPTQWTSLVFNDQVASITLTLPTGEYHVRGWIQDDRGAVSTAVSLFRNADSEVDLVVEQMGSMSTGKACSASSVGTWPGVVLALVGLAVIRRR